MDSPLRDMKKLDFTNYQVPNAPKSRISHRAEVIGMFVSKLNENRVGTKFKPLTASMVAVMLSTIKSVSDLRAFYGECAAAKNFSQYYFWRFKK